MAILTLGISGVSFKNPLRTPNLSNLRTITKYCEMVVVLKFCLVNLETKSAKV